MPEDKNPEFVPYADFRTAYDMAERATTMAEFYKKKAEDSEHDILQLIQFVVDLNNALHLDKLMKGDKLSAMAITGKIMSLIANPEPLKDLAVYLPEAKRLYAKYEPLINKAKQTLQITENNQPE